VTDFNAKVAQLDTYLGAGDMTNAQSTWNQIHTMMLGELAVTKANIAGATTDAARAAATTNMQTQTGIYRQAWTLKNDLAGNRAALHTKLVAFAGTF